MKDNNNGGVVRTNDDVLAEIKSMHEICSTLMKTPHYAKIGHEGIFAIVATAKSLGIDPIQALGGGLYYVKGKVEMSSRMMAAVIRSRGHSITRDSKSNDTICILHGKRRDSQDCWSVSFSIEEAQRAGLTRNPVWQNFAQDMLYARALSRLAKQLFPDLIGNVDVEGEISLDPNIKEDVPIIEEPIKKSEKISEEEYKELSFFLDQVPDYKAKVESFLQRKGIDNVWEMPKDMFQKVLDKAKEHVEKADEEKGGV